MRKSALAILALAVLVSARPLKADDGPPQPVQVVANILQLSNDQVASWMQILATRQQALAPVQQQLQANEKAIGAALQSPAPDAQAVGQLVIQRKSLEMQAGAINAEAATQFEQLLNDDQRKRLEQIRGAAHACPIVPAFAATGLLQDGSHP